MIISFTGAQSTGKSTLFKECKMNKRFKKFNYEPEITRYVKKKYNLTINEDGDDITQLAILNRHLYNCLEYNNKDVLQPSNYSIDYFKSKMIASNNFKKVQQISSNKMNTNSLNSRKSKKLTLVSQDIGETNEAINLSGQIELKGDLEVTATQSSS